MKWVFNATRQPLYPRERDVISIVPEAVLAPRPVRTGEEYFTHTGIRSTDRPGRGESLYRLTEFYMSSLSNVTPQTRKVGKLVTAATKYYCLTPRSLTLKTLN